MMQPIGTTTICTCSLSTKTIQELTASKNVAIQAIVLVASLSISIEQSTLTMMSSRRAAPKKLWILLVLQAIHQILELSVIE